MARTDVFRQAAGFSKLSDPWEDIVRATTAFNRLLALQGARVIDVLFGVGGMTVRVALLRRLAACSCCGQV